MNGIAESMVGTVTQHLIERHGPGWLPDSGEIARTTEMLEKMRSLAMESAQAELPECSTLCKLVLSVTILRER
ncbi:hypothetical protein NY08_2223 [Rhodococcus sp. B7740]|nr:hypothetical protein NY08_2223 [Rhodococcus sp. B7740]